MECCTVVYLVWLMKIMYVCMYIYVCMCVCVCVCMCVCVLAKVFSSKVASLLQWYHIIGFTVYRGNWLFMWNNLTLVFYLYFSEALFATLPRTTRGQPIVLGGDPKGNKFLYTNGNSVIIRDIAVSWFHTFYPKLSVFTKCY